MESAIPILEVRSGQSLFMKPTKRINDSPDVSHFLSSLAYRDICIFITQLNNSVCPRNQTEQRTPLLFPLTPTPSSTPSALSVVQLLANFEALIQQAPPDQGPRRFGNASFRKWVELLETNAKSLLKEGLLAETLQSEDGGLQSEVESYLLGSFGSAQRLDYGTGHELSFIAFLGCLWKLGHFKDGAQNGGIEREIVLHIVEPYLRVVRKLILTYNLEPAGSHGVWGLDDHSFIPYIFGSAQLTKTINEREPTPLEGSVRGAPKPGAITNSDLVEMYRSSNMYFSAIGFINDVKKGPFWEHSPMLFDISGIKDGWGKINKGMIKMYNAEVLSKFPVVQHFHFGSLFSWELDPKARAPVSSTHLASQPSKTAMAQPPMSALQSRGTAAPWAAQRQSPRLNTPLPKHSQINVTNEHTPFSETKGSGSTSAQITTKAPSAK